MNRSTFAEMTKGHVVILDGATGSNLMMMGMPKNVCTEAWLLDHPELVIELQKQYKEAGSRFIYAPTFSANRISLEKHGLSDKVEYLNAKLAEVTRKAVGSDCCVVGDLTTTGELLEPIGELEEEELFEAYREQAAALCKGGVDAFVAETLMDVKEAVLALKACRDVAPDLPFMATLTVMESGHAFYGGTAQELIRQMQELDADAAGINCSFGPDKLKAITASMTEIARIPVIVKPNAGLPETNAAGETFYSMKPETFVDQMQELVDLGAGMIGGCCGTTPAFIRLLAERLAR
ncbi:MAG: homocysteine S-methyltransferase family protein [Eubacteriales bacterium]|nr:homocysteine S-methyltransferase family protein [Eubacteriales bacterium]